MRQFFVINSFALIIGTLTGFASVKSPTMQSYHPPVFVDGDRLARIETLFPEIDARVEEFAAKNHFPGYAYGILLDGELVHSRTGGFTELDEKIPVTNRSMFRIASMTKSFTAMAIVKLRDEGKLRLDDPVSLYLPEMQNQQLTDDAPVLTIRDLLTHSAGYPTDDPWGDRKLDETDEELRAFLKEGLFFSNPAGTTFEYSNLGYAMLGSIIKKVTGISYDAYIAEHIWQPLGMEDVSWDYPEVPRSQLAQGYRWVDEEWQEEELLKNGSFGAMGGMIASLESFTQYVALHLSAWPPRDDADTGLIKRSSLREMHQPFRFRELAPNFKFGEGSQRAVTSAYGYGLHSLCDDLGRVFVGHSGGLPGFGSNWTIMPEYGLGVILLANATYAPANKMSLEILDKLAEKAQLKPRQLPPSAFLEERRNGLVKLLPDWEGAAASGIFSANFFQDRSIDSWRKETKELFAKAGKILSVGRLVPKSQSRGSFVIEGENSDIEASFLLTPENPPLIQQVQMKEVEKGT